MKKLYSESERSTNFAAETTHLFVVGAPVSASFAPLGRYTVSTDPPPLTQAAKGADSSEATKAAVGRRQNRSVRYELLSMAREILVKQGHLAKLEFPENFHRTAKCMHTPRGEVSVLRDKGRGNAFYAGLVACGSVWSCPVCATKIQERRRAEIAQAFAWAYSPEVKLQPVMITLTFPHKSWQDLGALVLQQREALTFLRYGKPWKKLVERVGYEGLIRSLEITHGANGWHPHTHEVWFVSQNVDADELKRDVLKQWASACKRAGLLDASNEAEMIGFSEHSVHAKGWCKDSDYLAKQDDSKNWGIDKEMAKGATKLGKLKGLHPFGLLARAADGDQRSSALFLEFATTMRRTRSRQLFWSHGLKGRVGIGEKTDEEVAGEQSEQADLLGLIDRRDWQLVRLYRRRAQLLDAAEGGGWPAVLFLLTRLRMFSCADPPGLAQESGPALVLATP